MDHAKESRTIADKIRSMPVAFVVLANASWSNATDITTKDLQALVRQRDELLEAAKEVLEAEDGLDYLEPPTVERLQEAWKRLRSAVEEK